MAEVGEVFINYLQLTQALKKRKLSLNALKIDSLENHYYKCFIN